MWFSRQFGVVGMIRVRVTRVTAIEKNRAWLQTTVVPGGKAIPFISNWIQSPKSPV